MLVKYITYDAPQSSMLWRYILRQLHCSLNLFLEFKLSDSPITESDTLKNINPRPLDGLRVIELGQILAGPFASAILGYFGPKL